MICPNCNSKLARDEQLIISPTPTNEYTVSHVQIYVSDDGLTLENICNNNNYRYTTLAIN